ncbi:MAG: armadillo-type protein, partial [Olpidium bornovanus]
MAVSLPRLQSSTLRKGKHKLYLHPGREADGGVSSSTPSKLAGVEDEMDRLEKAGEGIRRPFRELGISSAQISLYLQLVKKHERGDLTRLDWLDNLAFREIEKVNRRPCISEAIRLTAEPCLLQGQSMDSKRLFLYIDLPKFDFPLVFSEPEYDLPRLAPEMVSEPTIVHILDPEILRENPVEAKHRRLVRANRNTQLDRDLKPNAKNRDELAEILKYPPTQELATEEKDLLWKFRFYLTRNKKVSFSQKADSFLSLWLSEICAAEQALTKFLKCVTWSDATEAKQAVELLSQWANIDVDDALELLGPNFHNRS